MNEYLDNGYIYYYDTLSMMWTIYELDNIHDDYQVPPEYFKNKTKLLKKYPNLKFTPKK